MTARGVIANTMGVGPTRGVMEQNDMERPVIIVHAPYHQPAHYEPLTVLLRSRTTVITPDVGHLALDEGTRAVQEAVDGLSVPPIVMSHSFSGAVAGALHGVDRLVFLSAFVLEADETAGTVLEPALARDPDGGGRFLAAVRPSEDGHSATIDPTLAEDLFYNGCRPDAVARAVSLLRPAITADFEAHPVAVRWRNVPTLFIRTLRDHAWAAGLQETFAQRCDRQVTVDSGHAPFISQPDEIAAIVSPLL